MWTDGFTKNRIIEDDGFSKKYLEYIRPIGYNNWSNRSPWLNEEDKTFLTIH